MELVKLPKNSKKQKNTKTQKHKNGQLRHYQYDSQEKQELKQIGAFLKKEMNKKNLSAQALDFSSGVSRNAIKSIIEGNSNFKFLNIRAIALALNFKSVESFLASAKKHK